MLLFLDRDRWWVHFTLPSKKVTGAWLTVMTVWAVEDAGGVPASVAVKVTVVTRPPSGWHVPRVQLNVPDTGFPVEVCLKVAPVGSPVAVRVMFSLGSAVSDAVTVNVNVVPTVAVSVAGAVIVGGVLAAAGATFTVWLEVAVAPLESVAVTVTVKLPLAVYV
jgi:hypothetical protein